MKLQKSGNLWLLILLFFAFSWNADAQKREIGFSLGAMYYTGDLARNWVLPQTGFAGMLLLRTNLNNHLSLRVAYTGGNLKGSDAKPIDPFAATRASSFNIFISVHLNIRKWFNDAARNYRKSIITSTVFS